MKGPRPNKISLRERFDQKWRLDTASGCWIWEGAIHVHGYGKLYRDGKLYPAHRIGWELYKGPIERGMFLDHTCHRKNCVNPNHLEPVTNEENVRRRNARGHTYEQLPTLRLVKRKRTLKELFDLKWKRDETTDCWNWTASKNIHGYGQISKNGRPRGAYRVGYELYIGEIPDGLVLDHLCRNPGCVNPEHLEPVTHAENVRRGIAPQVTRDLRLAKTHCKRGHPLSGDNLSISSSNGQRICKACRSIRKKKYRGPLKGLDLTGLKLGAAVSAAKRKALTHCRNGHPYSGTNLIVDSETGWRRCRECLRNKIARRP